MSLDERVTNLESLLGLPDFKVETPSSSDLAALRLELSASEKARARQSYRLLHLTRAYDALAAKVSALETASQPASK
jgi:hypothetical protein